ncbi:MAG: CBS domain-containing protein [Candidatus Helarchaeales archaeon]
MEKDVQTKFIDVMSPYVVFVDVSDKVPTIARKMMTEWVDTVFVKEGNETVGMITDGIIWKLISEADPKIYEYTSRDIMFKDFIVVDGERPFCRTHKELKELLKDSPIKRIAVRNSKGQIIGVLKTKFFDRVKKYSRTFNVVFKKNLK